MERRLEIFTKAGIRDGEGERLCAKIKKTLNLDIACKFIEVYNFTEKLTDSEMKVLADEVFVDHITQGFNFKEPTSLDQWRIEIGMLPGVTDNVGKTASVAVKDKLAKEIPVFYSRIYALSGKLDVVAYGKIAAMLHNPLVEKYHLHMPGDTPPPYLPVVRIPKQPEVEKIALNIPKAKLELLARQRLLALSYEELCAIKDHFKGAKVIAERKKHGLDEKITDVELEALAQTWSEHCKHKIFNAQITYDENGESHAINSVFKTFIKAATTQVKKPYVVSVFKDNGGIIKFNHNYDIAIKVETHNAPSALDPYGGALTGVLGVQRDVLGTGLGANPIANIDVLCFGYPNTPETDVPKGVIHPNAICEGVVKGVEHGGNKMGIPTVNGSIIFDSGYLCRPLVYCGTAGIMPAQIGNQRTCEKKILPDYLAIMVGGRIGKDGIHGATFSSMQIDSSIPQSVVQIGDPITQKKMLDFILEARDNRLYDAITDNGAGGLSSSVGELAQISGGCEIYLDSCPLKYSGLDPWEILVSESQERMTIASSADKLEILRELAKKHDVEISVVGKFTSSKKFHVFYQGKTVAYLDMEFLHEGVPQLKLNAVWKKMGYPEPIIGEISLSSTIKKLLSSPNITTKERVVRTFDHEVKGMSVVKPIMSGPSDAAVIRPIYDSKEGLVISHGICPRYVQDGYSMSAMAFDEAVRNAISAGAKFGYLAALDNFSWPDPIKSEKTQDGEQKLGSLVRACIALYDCAINYGVPIISGKDSMKNDYYAGDRKYSIPPTLLVSVIGKIDNVRNAMTTEFKNAGAIIYVLGKTRDELGGSEFYRLFNGIGNKPPQIYPEEHVPLYRALSNAIEERLVSSCHDVSDGGLAVAFAECALGMGLGAELELNNVPAETEKSDCILFSESAGRFIVSVDPENAARFEQVMHGTIFAKAGRVRGDKRVIIKNQLETIVNEPVEDLWAAYNKGI